jgi:SAM-dependent methyltransferase
MSEGTMREFWDARAAEDAFYFVDNRLEYGSPDAERFWAGGAEVLDAMLPQLGVAIDPGDDIVEIGCGVGRVTRALAERGSSVRAIDVSPAMLERARAFNPGLANVEWLLGDGRTLTEIEPASADACFSWVVFQHLPDPEMTLGYVREIGRVLRKGGWAAIQVSNRPEIHRRRSAFRRLLAKPRELAGRGPRGQADPAWLGSAVDLGRLREVAFGAGMDTERVVGEGTQYCLVLLRARG